MDKMKSLFFRKFDQFKISVIFLRLTSLRNKNMIQGTFSLLTIWLKKAHMKFSMV